MNLLAGTVLTLAMVQADPDREINLDISEKTITESNYRAATSVHLRSSDGHLTVDAGAAVEAREIRMTLRGVRGQATLRASLNQLQQVFNRYETSIRGGAR